MDSLAHLENSKLKFKKEICWFSWDSSYRINRMGELGWSSETGDNRKTKRSFGSPSFALERHMDGASKISDSSTCSWWFCKKTETKNVMMGEMNIYILMSLPPYAEFKALIWTSECMKTMQILDVELATHCFELVKDSATSVEWSAFSFH